MDDGKLVVNKGYCPICNDKLQSRHRHHYVECECGESALDGGLEYVRVIGKTVTEPLYEGDNWEEIRKYHCRGGRGKSGDHPLTWVPLCEMSNEWLMACVVYNLERNMRDNLTTSLYEKELEFREENGIFVND